MMRLETKHQPDSNLEIELIRHGIERIAGIDEAGRGAWAGPVTAAAVVLPPPGPGLDEQLKGLKDSKQLTQKQRERWDLFIRRIAEAVSVGFANVNEIDQIGILPATKLAMRRAVLGLATPVQHLLIDYILIGDIGINQTAIPRGDCRVFSIAAASVVAKVARDEIMRSLDLTYPRFGFAQHKGYGTRQHQSALNRFGASPIHRQSFAPIQRAINCISAPT